MHTTHRHEPALGLPVGAYMTDGQTLVRILECDYSGALGEDALTLLLVSIEPQQLIKYWWRVHPAREGVKSL